MSRGAKVATAKHGWTLLHLLVTNPSESGWSELSQENVRKCIVIFLSHGIDINARDELGRTCLGLAVQRKMPRDCLDFLAKWGARSWRYNLLRYAEDPRGDDGEYSVFHRLYHYEKIVAMARSDTGVIEQPSRLSDSESLPLPSHEEESRQLLLGALIRCRGNSSPHRATFKIDEDVDFPPTTIFTLVSAGGDVNYEFTHAFERPESEETHARTPLQAAIQWYPAKVVATLFDRSPFIAVLSGKKPGSILFGETALTNGLRTAVHRADFQPNTFQLSILI